MQDIEGLGTLAAGNDALFRQPFVKRFAICYRTTVLTVWPVCNVHVRYYGQMVEWIKIKLDTELGLGPGHIVLDEDPASPQKRHSPPIFSPHMLWPNGWTDQDATWYGGRPRPRRHGFTWGLSSSPPPLKGGHSSLPPIFGLRICKGLIGFCFIFVLLLALMHRWSVVTLRFLHVDAVCYGS